jgi:flagellar hook protein FlgE
MTDFSIPLAGMSAAEGSSDRAATRIANIAGNMGGDSVDLSAGVVALIEARNNFAANVKVVQAEDQMTRSLYELVG